MTTRTLTATLFAAAALAGLGIGFALAAPRGNTAATAAAEARSVAVTFFRTIDQRRYGQTCDLLSTSFYRRNHVPDKRHCMLGLSVGMAMAPSYRFEITNVRMTRRGALVSALANGVPGRLVLVREGSSFKILAVQGA
jgi:hypothetical protein